MDPRWYRLALASQGSVSKDFVLRWESSRQPCTRYMGYCMNTQPSVAEMALTWAVRALNNLVHSSMELPVYLNTQGTDDMTNGYLQEAKGSCLPPFSIPRTQVLPRHPDFQTSRSRLLGPEPRKVLRQSSRSSHSCASCSWLRCTCHPCIR